MSTPITVVGNLAADPELRFTPSGAAVANCVVLETTRVLNRQTNEWEDGDTTRYKVAVWRQAAENVAESLVKGMTVIVQGTLVGKPWSSQDGKSGTDLEITADHIGPSLKFATAKVTRASRSGGQQNTQGGQQQAPAQGGAQQGWGQPQGQQQAPAQGGAQQGWGQPQGQQQPAGAAAGGGWGNVAEDEPPF